MATFILIAEAIADGGHVTFIVSSWIHGVPEELDEV